jgi:hypothetical protein
VHLRALSGSTPASLGDVLYNDNNIHFSQLVRISDWVSHAWGVPAMAAGQRLMYNKLVKLPYQTWRLVRDPRLDKTVSTDNTILLSTSVMNIVSRDYKLVWSCGADGYLQLLDYATALMGDAATIGVRMVEKHGVASYDGKPLRRGMHWNKMKFGAPGGGDVTPSDSGVAWKPMADASYKANRVIWEYGFEVQDVDFSDPSVL